MNYNQINFWIFLAVLLGLYWRLSPRRQTLLLLAASYAFYGYWDYRFLFLILVSTIVDFIGGLGVAGVRPAPRVFVSLAGTALAAALLLCSQVNYPGLLGALGRGDSAALAASLPRNLRDFAIPLGTLAAILLYAGLIRRFYALPDARRRKCFLVLSLGVNLGILGFFKYYDFFVSSLSSALSSLGIPCHAATLSLILPAGISFYTFQAMSYTIDVYRHRVEPTPDFACFSVFVAFFPHLIAGPIMRAHELLPQVVQPRKLQPGALEEGLLLVAMGLIKKVAIADTMAPIVNGVFQHLARQESSLTGAEVLMAVYAFAFQIYGDFSGYSAIARGIAKWLGFELVINFDRPYLATSPSEFWKRWHISLSTWLKDYLYIPLGGNRQGTWREYRNLWITMLLGGLWHGASWTFVAWGAYHATILCLYRGAGAGQESSPSRWRRPFRIVTMFHLTCFGWLLFRADSLGSVARALRLIFTRFDPTTHAATGMLLILAYAGGVFLLELAFEGERRIARLSQSPRIAQIAFSVYAVFMIVIMRAGTPSSFIYFQF